MDDVWAIFFPERLFQRHNSLNLLQWSITVHSDRSILMTSVKRRDILDSERCHTGNVCVLWRLLKGNAAFDDELKQKTKTVWPCFKMTLELSEFGDVLFGDLFVEKPEMFWIKTS